MSMFPALMDAALLMAASPSKTCKVRVSSSRYRNDPYRARVLPRFMTALSPVAFAPKQQTPRFYVPSAVIMPLTGFAPQPQQTYAAAAARAAPEAFDFGAAASAGQLLADAFDINDVPLVNTTNAAASSTGKSAPVRGATEHYALVGFKHETAMYLAPFRVAVGDAVVVEADRGEHVGVVQSLTTVKPGYNVPCRVVRRANVAEMATIDELTAKEARVAAAVQKQSESLGLGIRVVDVEFQTDMNKLTVFFASKCFVDFRKLQRALFREFRCRIWLVNWTEVQSYTPVPVNPAPCA